MKKVLLLLPLLALGLASCGGTTSPSSISESVSDSASESVSDSVSTSEAPTDWTAEEKATIESVLGSGHIIPFVYIPDFVLEDGGNCLFGSSASAAAAEVASYRATYVSAGYSITDSDSADLSKGWYGTKDADETHYWYAQVEFDSTSAGSFSLFVQYITLSDTYPSADVAAVLSSAQAAALPAIAKQNDTESFEYMVHSGYGFIDLIESNSATITAANTAYAALLTSNGFTYNSTYGGYINSTVGLFVAVSEYSYALDVYFQVLA